MRNATKIQRYINFYNINDKIRLEKKVMFKINENYL